MKQDVQYRMEVFHAYKFTGQEKYYWGENTKNPAAWDRKMCQLAVLSGVGTSGFFIRLFMAIFPG